MKSINLSTTIVIFIGLFIWTEGAFTNEAKGKKIKGINKIVTVRGYEGAQPNTLTIEAGTTVIWVNYDRQPIEILFLDKKVELTYCPPANFFVKKDEAHELEKIPFGGTASFCFIEKGKYEYMVKSARTFYRLGGEKKSHGIIWIQ